jgi:hypothetical protein
VDLVPHQLLHDDGEALLERQRLGGLLGVVVLALLRRLQLLLARHQQRRRPAAVLLHVHDAPTLHQARGPLAGAQSRLITRGPDLRARSGVSAAGWRLTYHDFTLHQRTSVVIWSIGAFCGRAALD